MGKELHWIEKFMRDFDIKTRYELSKLTGLTNSTLNSLISRNTPINKTAYGTIKSLAECVGIDMNRMDELLETYETESMKDD